MIIFEHLENELKQAITQLSLDMCKRVLVDLARKPGITINPATLARLEGPYDLDINCPTPLTSWVSLDNAIAYKDASLSLSSSHGTYGNIGIKFPAISIMRPQKVKFWNERGDVHERLRYWQAYSKTECYSHADTDELYAKIQATYLLWQKKKKQAVKANEKAEAFRPGAQIGAAAAKTA